METIYYPISRKLPALCAACGVFDGVHRGHYYVLEMANAIAKKYGTSSAAITFAPHPRSVLTNAAPAAMLTTFAEKQARLERMGIDFLVVIPFTAEFAKLTAAEFLGTYLKENLSVESLVVGCNQCLGSDRVGDFAAVKEIASSIGIDVYRGMPAEYEGIEVSSTRIRTALAEGDTHRAAMMLGYRYKMGGIVQSGRGFGRSIGFPTANIAIDESKCVPCRGVYAIGAALDDGDDVEYAGMLNIGVNPTVSSSGQLSIEAHLFNFEGDIYGHFLHVYLFDRLRSERKFSSPMQLQAALAMDEREAQNVILRNCVPR
jgi:riboflavin kinase/FMN adenylyltransferase